MMTYPHRGDVTAAPYGEEMQKYEATRSGGTVNPREMTKAAARKHIAEQKSEKRKQRTISRAAQRGVSKAKKSTPRGREFASPSQTRTKPSSRPSGYAAVRKYGRAGGGLVGIDYLTRRL